MKLILAFMEPMRPVVDRVVLKLVVEDTFSGADFDLQSDGVLRMNPELVRAISLALAVVIHKVVVTTPQKVGKALNGLLICNQ